MLSQVTFNKEKWISAMMLDPITGLDSAGAKIRPAEGIDAASTFIQGYWLWWVRRGVSGVPRWRPTWNRSKIVENLAVINYDTNNLHLSPYDWRLSFWNLEERDGYFSKLKTTIEGFKWVIYRLHTLNRSKLGDRKRHKRKVVIVAHSMGSTVMLVSAWSLYSLWFLNKSVH